MSKPKAVGGECVRLQDGESFTIVAIVVDGACPAIEFLKGLDSRPRAKFDYLLGRLAVAGRLRNPQEFRWWQDGGSPKVAEVKVHFGQGHRLFIIQQGKYMFVTHGSEKLAEKRAKAEIEKARRSYSDWLRSV